MKFHGVKRDSKRTGDFLVRHSFRHGAQNLGFTRCQQDALLGFINGFKTRPRIRNFHPQAHGDRAQRRIDLRQCCIAEAVPATSGCAIRG